MMQKRQAERGKDMYNRRYEKVFLMLRQETAGYGIGKRQPWGSCVMELKNGSGRLHLTVQGLKPFLYEVYVMAGEESVFCGELRPEDREGRGELKWDFAPDDVGEGKKAEDFHTVIILAEGGSAPLTAYFKEKRNWKQDFLPRKKEEPLHGEEVLIAAEKQEEQEKTFEKVAEMQKESYHGSFQGLLAKFRQELEELEETGVLTEEETARIRSVGEEPQVKVQGKKGKELFASNLEMDPFGDGAGWKQISLEEICLLSQIPLKWQKEFFFLLPWRKYHHLILREEEKGVWLGLPGQFNAADAADAHTFGFHEFRNTEGDWGYWMAFLEWNS